MWVKKIRDTRLEKQIDDLIKKIIYELETYREPISNLLRKGII